MSEQITITIYPPDSPQHPLYEHHREWAWSVRKGIVSMCTSWAGNEEFARREAEAYANALLKPPSTTYNWPPENRVPDGNGGWVET